MEPRRRDAPAFSRPSPRATSTTAPSARTTTLIEDEDFDDIVNGTDFGLVFGGGLDVRLPVTGMVTLDARYTTGFSDVFDDEVVLDGADVKNRAFQVSLGFGL